MFTKCEAENIAMMMFTLKIIGVAFERDSALQRSRATDKEKSDLEPVEIALIDIGIADLFHYCFTFIGQFTCEFSYVLVAF